jgi:hypothetical protein
MLKHLPKILALLGAGATITALLAAVFIEQYSLHAFFRYDYEWMQHVVLPMLIAGVPTGFFGTIWWARRWNPGTRIGTAVALFLACGAMMMVPGNVHGAGGLLILTFIPMLLLGIVLLIFGLAGRAST